MIDASEFERTLKQSMYETGVSVDPTKDMSPEDAAEWKRQNEKHKDNFKSASKKTAENGYVEETLREALGKMSLASGGMHYRLYDRDQGKLLQHGTPEYQIVEEARQKVESASKLVSAALRGLDKVDLQFTGRMASVLSASDYEEELDKESKFEKGKSMTPEQVSKVVGPEFAENVENPPEAVKKLQKEMESKSATADKEAAKLQARQIKILKDYITENSGRFISWFDDLPQEVQSALVRVKDSETLHMDVDRWLGDNNKTAAKRVHFKPGDKLVVKPVPPGLQKSYPASKWMTAQVEVEAIDEGASDGLDVYDVKTPGGEEESIYGFQVVKKVASSESDKTAATGLYGFTKEAEKVCGSAANKLAKFATKLAKDIYEKDSGTPAFLEEHTARTSSKAARMLRGCMAEIGPGQPAKTAAKGEKGRYGFSAKTARLALEACNAVEHEAGVIASDLDARMGTKYAAITGFLNKHAKRAKCGWSDLILEAYPTQSEQIIASEEAVEKTASDLSGYEVHPSVAEILTWDGQGTPRAAASFLASEDDDILAGRTWDGDKSTPDDATPYNIHPKSPPAGADGSEQRWKYNQWFRENVCPGHKTNCGL